LNTYEEISNPKNFRKPMENPWIIFLSDSTPCSHISIHLPFRDLGEDVFALLVGLDVRRNLHWTALGAGQSRGAGIRKKIAWRGRRFPVWPWFGGFPLVYPLRMTNIAIENI
jgi:hypothetical protein